MNVLITGAGGWLGSELTEQLLFEGNTVTAINLGESVKLKKLKKKYSDKLNIVYINITEYDVIEELIKNNDELYHLAAKVHFIPTNEREKEEFYEINTEASKKIFDFALKYKMKRIIYYSTVSVYEQGEGIINSDSLKKPSTPYGMSKLIAEEYGLKLFNEDKLPITIIQPVTVYGEGDVGNFKKLENIINKGVIVTFGNGENKKTVIYYKDLVKLTIKIAKDISTVGRRVICGTEVLSINDINKLIIESSKRNVCKIKVKGKVLELMLLIAKLIPFKISKKVCRQIEVLMSNNIYDISASKKLLNDNMTFQKYYIGE